MTFRIFVEQVQKDSKFRIRVAGLLDGDGIKLLKKACQDILKKKKAAQIDIDLEEISFISEDGTHGLRQLQNTPQIRLVNPQFLTLAMMKDAEAN